MRWIDTQPDYDAAMDQVAAQNMIAVDTEADSLHSYFDKVCLIQISTADEDYVIDPLAKIDLAAFGRALADPGTVKILHGADYDLRILNRDFGFVVSNLIDTMVCAQLLGYEAFGLAALLERHFGLKLDKAHQRADWAMRPLPADMLAYAASDTRNLIALAAKLRGELEALGRWEWAREEFSRLEAIRYRDKEEREGDEPAPEPFRRLKGMNAFDRRSLAVARALHEWRDALARKADRPPFKIIGNDVLVEIAKNKAASTEALNNIKILSQYHRNRYGRDLARLVREALDLPESQLPERAEPRPWIRDKELEARVNKMKTVRDRVAKELKIDPSVLAARHILTAVAQSGTLDVPAMREWQKSVLGEALLATL
jgi:ribonuclease D